MRELLDRIENWRNEGKQVAVATVIEIWGSAPRRPGSRMAISSDGELAGSVSGGCVEAALYEDSRDVLETGRPKLVRYGVPDEKAWSVGLTCGGTIEVFVERLAVPGESREIHEAMRDAILREEAVALATVIDGPAAGNRILVRRSGEVLGGLGSPDLDGKAVEHALAHLPRAATRREGILFLETLPPRDRLVIVGAVHIAIPLVAIARELGYRTYVVDPRKVFATPERFPHADELIDEWPHRAMERIGIGEGTSVAVLCHDDKIDVPALKAVLESPARYVGVLGSKRTHARRVEKLLEAGVSREAIERIHAPIGLDLGGRKPEEIALAIMAEVVAAANRSGPAR
jgi:xanthine dehydrogenase accessory factor